MDIYIYIHIPVNIPLKNHQLLTIAHLASGLNICRKSLMTHGPSSPCAWTARSPDGVKPSQMSLWFVHKNYLTSVCRYIYIYNVYMFIYIYIYMCVYYMHMYILVALNWIIPNMAIFRLNHQRLGISRVFWHRSSWHRALFFAFTGVPFERGHATNSSPFLRSSQDINSGGFVLKQKNYAKKKKHEKCLWYRN